MSLLYRPKPLSGEAFSSYIHRIAKANYVTVHELWRLISKEGIHYPQASASANIDIYPYSIVEMNLLNELLKFDHLSLDTLTFIPVYEKLGLAKNYISNSRILSGIVSQYRKYCPDCIGEMNSYKLIWQVNELNFCPEHNMVLLNRCTSCNRTIPILPNVNDLGICPFCNCSLSTNKSIYYVLTNSDYRILNDWLYLLDASKAITKPINGLSEQQNLAIRVIYSSEGLNLSNQDLTTLRCLQQIVRESKVTQTSVHLKSILHFIRIKDTSLEDFFTKEIPEEYIYKYLKKPGKLINRYHCIAPWCDNYLISGKLNRTSTSSKRLLNGEILNYYLYCPCCGIEYAIDNKSKVVKERGYFVGLAWHKVKSQLNNNFSLIALAKLFDTTEEKIRRSIIYLSANSLIDTKHLNLDLPEYHDQNITKKIKELIQSGHTSKKIKTIVGLSYNKFLYYWFLPEVKIMYMNRHLSRPDKKANTHEISNNFANAIKQLSYTNNKITIKSVCKIMGKSPETLRNNGLLSKIKEYKEHQNQIVQKEKRSIYLNTAEKYIEEKNLLGFHVFSDELYLHLGKNRTVIVRTMPEVTRKIADLLKNQSV